MTFVVSTIFITPSNKDKDCYENLGDSFGAVWSTFFGEKQITLIRQGSGHALQVETDKTEEITLPCFNVLIGALLFPITGFCWLASTSCYMPSKTRSDKACKYLKEQFIQPTTDEHADGYWTQNSTINAYTKSCDLDQEACKVKNSPIQVRNDENDTTIRTIKLKKIHRSYRFIVPTV